MAWNKYDEGFNHGLAAASTWLRTKADKMRMPVEEWNSVTPNMMALIYEAEADGILSLRKEP